MDIEVAVEGAIVLANGRDVMVAIVSAIHVTDTTVDYTRSPVAIRTGTLLCCDEYRESQNLNKKKPAHKFKFREHILLTTSASNTMMLLWAIE
jgi:hypothetical protein